jgi:hypothetical protein
VYHYVLAEAGAGTPLAVTVPSGYVINGTTGLEPKTISGGTVSGTSTGREGDVRFARADTGSGPAPTESSKRVPMPGVGAIVVGSLAALALRRRVAQP